MNNKLVLKHSVIAVAFTLSCSTIVKAQVATDAQTVTVYVTGSNLKRTQKEGASPVETISLKQIEDSGANTVAELLHSIPAFGSGASIDTVDGGFSKGASTASLRGLGSSSTLVLLNGRRITASAYADPSQGKSAVYDLNNIPISAIERVEIFKDGASAVYGSDAIAGVINFITRKDYQGAQIAASASGNDGNDFQRQNVSGSFGIGNIVKDKYNFFVSADLANRGSTLIGEVRDIDTGRYASINGRLNPYSSNLSNQPFFYRERTPNARNFANTYALRADVINRTACDPSSQLVGNTTDYNIGSTSTLFGRRFCNFDLNQYAEAQSAGKDGNVLSRLTLDLGPDLTSFTEFSYSRSERTYLGAPKSLQSTSPATVFKLGAASDFQLILPVGHPDNPFPTSRSAVGLRFNDIGGSKNLNQTYRFVTGLTGSHSGWDWDAALLWNRNNRIDNGFGLMYKPTLQRIMTEGRTIAATLSDPSATVTTENRNFAQVIQFDAKASTVIGKLSGGEVGLAFGGEVREERIGVRPDSNSATGNIINLANAALEGSRVVSSAFIEARAPFSKSFEMEFAGRVDRYPDHKSFVPKVGAKWEVTPTAMVRGAYARGFRAPALLQISPGGVQSFPSVNDSIRCPDGVRPVAGGDQADCLKGISSLSGGTPGLEPERSRSYTLGLVMSPTKNVDVLVDYYNIRKEQETALLGAQFVVDHASSYPGRVIRDPNPAVQLIDSAGRPIPNTGPITAVNRAYVNQGSTEVSGIDLEVALRQSLGRFGRLTSKLNWGYTISYRRAEQPGDAEANAAGTNGGISDFATSVGDIPRHRTAWNTTWTTGKHSMTASVDFVSSVSLMRRSDNHQVYPVPYCHYGTGQPSTATQLGGLARFTASDDGACEVNGWTTLGTSYAYSGVKNWIFSLNIRNLLDTKAPYDPRYSSPGFNTQLHNGQGRYFRVRAQYKFK
ncbi:MAG: TonB-dependent receptor [Pseudomonadota bacterium]